MLYKVSAIQQKLLSLPRIAQQEVDSSNGECNTTETDEFAKNCTAGGGFFKCCTYNVSAIQQKLMSMPRIAQLEVDSSNAV